jgi:hypothetical protein
VHAPPRYEQFEMITCVFDACVGANFLLDMVQTGLRLQTILAGREISSMQETQRETLGSILCSSPSHQEPWTSFVDLLGSTGVAMTSGPARELTVGAEDHAVMASKGNDERHLVSRSA